MAEGKYVIAYDIGTTGVKTCIFSISDRIELVAAHSEGYKLYVMPNGGAEQDPTSGGMQCVSVQIKL